MKPISIIGACLTLMLNATVVGLAQGQGGRGPQGAAAAGAQPSGAYVMRPQPVIADIPLIDHHGQATSLRQALDNDQPVLVNFIFTTCTTICPIMTAGFAQFQATLGADRDRVQLVSISIDPDTDTVDVLRAYAERHDAGPNWRFFTGTAEAVETAQRAFGAFRGDAFNHAPVTYFRRGKQSPWEELDGLSSAAALLRLYRGDHASGH